MERVKTETIQMTLFDYFKEEESFSLKEAEELVLQVKKKNVKLPSVRARIYEAIDKGLINRITKGVYSINKEVNGENNTCLLINGDGRDLSFIKDGTIDGIITDHPYDLKKELDGGNRHFATYNRYKYTKEDFQEKIRILKKGAFLVEFLPEEKATNYEYLYYIKQIAIECGFEYYSKVPWKKGNVINNTGVKAKNSEDVLIFSNGPARKLRLDTKKNKAILRTMGYDEKFIKRISSYAVRDLLIENDKEVFYMKGTKGMLPAVFDFLPRSDKEKVMQAEKPVALLESIIEYITLPNELIIDNHAGSMSTGIAAYNKNRNSILIEQNEEIFMKGKAYLESELGENMKVEKDIEGNEFEM